MASNGFDLAERGMPGHGAELVSPGASLEVTYRFERPGS